MGYPSLCRELMIGLLNTNSYWNWLYWNEQSANHEFERMNITPSRVMLLAPSVRRMMEPGTCTHGVQDRRK